MNKDYPWGKGTPRWVRDAALNDSDKSFTVPAGKVWDIKKVYGELTCTATVGNRFLCVSVTDGTNVIFRSVNSAGVASQEININLLFTGGTFYDANALTDLAGNAQNLSRSQCVGPMILPAGYVIRVYDLSGIDPAADDLTVVLHYVEYDL